MESQNHYYGHSGAFARYAGLSRPRHIRGLVQHGWTSAAPTTTHFRDFPSIGSPGGRQDRSLFVWSHSSRAWDPAAERRTTIPIGAPWTYLCAAVDALPGGPAARAPRAGTVIMPVHGIPTQRMNGDHSTVAREWLESEGPSTVCLYHVEARDPRIVAAYVDAGHRCVTLGLRTEGAFLGRLFSLLDSAERVVSNRLSTPVVYAAARGVDVAVTGDPMRLDDEPVGAADHLRSTWPEFYDPSARHEDRVRVARDEVGERYRRGPEELRGLLGWDRPVRIGTFLEHWLAAPASRALMTTRRRAATPDQGTTGATAPLSGRAWLAGALAYLPRPLNAVEDPSSWRPLSVG